MYVIEIFFRNKKGIIPTAYHSYDDALKSAKDKIYGYYVMEKSFEPYLKHHYVVENVDQDIINITNHNEHITGYKLVDRSRT